MALIIEKYDYRIVTRDLSATIDWLLNPAPVNKAITAFSTPLKTLTLQKLQKVKKAAYEIQ